MLIEVYDSRGIFMQIEVYAHVCIEVYANKIIC